MDDESGTSVPKNKRTCPGQWLYTSLMIMFICHSGTVKNKDVDMHTMKIDKRVKSHAQH